MTIAKSANEAWIELLGRIMYDGHDAAPRGQKTREILACQTVIDMTRPIVTVKERVEGRYYAFMFAEAAWILSGDNRVETIAPYSRMISNFSDDGVYFRGAYGPKIVDQLTFVVDQLVADPDTRQAVINIWRENPRPTKDVPCTISAQFMIRDGLLHCFDTMRSSDAWLGVVYDLFNFSMLSHYVCLLLRKRGVVVTPGALHFTAASQHVYERNFEKVEKIIESYYDPLDRGLSVEDGYAPLNIQEFVEPDFRPADFINHLSVGAFCLLEDVDFSKKRKFAAEILCKE
jgi:thymidylate synthase